MRGLLFIEMYTITTIMIVFGFLFFGSAIGIIIWMVFRNNKKTEERMSRTVTTFGNDGTNFGTYSSAPTTKFLVVYRSGDREIVSVRDNSTLCNEYLRRLKTDETNNDKELNNN